MHHSDTTVGYVEPDSYAYEAGIEAGDRLLTINGHDFRDILEYRYLISEYEVELEVLKKNGDCEKIFIENDYEDLGIEFENALIDTAQSCRNKCIFCFIDQLPPGMRETVYFKDDDTRLSFLQGNYVTLTNLNDEDINRLIAMHISPINISVHTTNPELRVKMLNNKNAGNVFSVMKHFAENNMYMNCQIVLCRGYNDGEELERTIADLVPLYPYVESVSVVPVGLTAYREGLCELKAYDRLSSYEVVKQVEAIQTELLEKIGTRLIYLSDEFYINAKLHIPDAQAYEGFPQLENGVGLVASLKEEFDMGMEYLDYANKKREVTVVTGELVYGFISGLCERLMQRCNGLEIHCYPIKNNFFGGCVNVSGLVVGSDIKEQLLGKAIGEEIFIPSSMLRAGEDVFLDNMTLDELEKELQTKIIPIDNDGYEFIEKITGKELDFAV